MGLDLSFAVRQVKRGVRRLIRYAMRPILRWRAMKPKYEAYAVYHTGFLAILRRRSLRANRRLVILMYHSIGQSHLHPASRVSEENFEGQVRYLSRYYPVISLEHAVHLLQQDAPLPSNAVVITFDDGYRDNYEKAFPILQRYRCPATVFVSTDPLDTGRWLWPTRLYFWLSTTTARQLHISLGSERRQIFALSTALECQRAYYEINQYLRRQPPHEREARLVRIAESLAFDPKESPSRASPMLTWEQVRVMSEAGITIGSHTVTHPNLATVDRHEAERELVESKRVIERQLQRPIEFFAYPFGLAHHFDAATELMARRVGYEAACSAIHGFNSPGENLFSLRRLYIPDEPPPLFARRLLQAIPTEG